MPKLTTMQLAKKINHLHFKKAYRNDIMELSATIYADAFSATVFHDGYLNWVMDCLKNMNPEIISQKNFTMNASYEESSSSFLFSYKANLFDEMEDVKVIRVILNMNGTGQHIILDEGKIP
jgi:hypothetical protein